MSSQPPHDLTLTLPPLTTPQVEVILEVLLALQDALVVAYQDELLAAEFERGAAARDAELEAADLDEALWAAPPDRT
jgi:hypothetical protein